jgi:hypothetical protein
MFSRSLGQMFPGNRLHFALPVALLSAWLLTPSAFERIASAQDPSGEPPAVQDPAVAAAPAYETIPFAAEFQLPDESGLNPNDRDEVEKIKEARKQVEDKRGASLDLAKSAAAGRGNLGAIDTWINGFVIPQMSQSDDATLTRLGDIRQNFYRTFLGDSANGNARNRVIELLVPGLKRIAEGNFHPACRVNAVYFIGRLNSQEGSRGTAAPVPYADALDYLMGIARTDTNPEYLRVAAMSGIERHASIRGPDPVRPMDAGKVVELNELVISLFSQTPSDKLSAEAIHWFKRRGIAVIGFLGAPGDNGRYARALRDIIANRSEKMLVRTDALLAYSRLKFPDAAAANVSEIAELAGQLVVEAGDAELLYMEEQLNNIEFVADMFGLDAASAGDSSRGGVDKGGGGGGGTSGTGEEGGDGGGGAGAMGKSDPKRPPEIIPSYHRELVKRRFKHYLWTCRVALAGSEKGVPGGLSVLARDKDAEFISKMVAVFDELMIKTDVRDPADYPEEKKKDEKGSKGNKGDEKATKPDDEEGPKTTYAQELLDQLAANTRKINELIGEFRPKAGEGAAGGAGEGSDGK